MKRMITTALCLVLLLAALPLAVSAEGECDINGHDFAEATCTDAKKCTICGAEEGEPLGHDWQAATCTKPKTCKRCKLTEGKSNGHEMLPANCTYPKRCKNCNKIVGDPLKHTAGKTSCGEKPKCIYCGKNMGAAEEHYYAEDWDDTCTKCGHVRDVDYDYVISVGETLVLKEGGIVPFSYKISDDSILEKVSEVDSSNPAVNDTGYTYCIKGTFVGRKAGAVQVYTMSGHDGKGWLIKVVKSNKATTKSTAKPTTKSTTAKPTTKATEKPTEPSTEPTTEPTTEATTEPTTEPTTEATESTTVPTAATAKPAPKKPNAWPIVGGVAAVIAVASVAAVIFIKRKK